MVENTCALCDKTFQTFPKSRRTYCSVDCLNVVRRAGGSRARYRVVYAPGHPLLPPKHKNQIGEHRYVLWAKIGPGPHGCHYCDTQVNWAPGMRTARGSLVVDHLDRDTHNNDPANLVASCQGCNGKNSARPKRGIKEGEPHIVGRNGARVRGVKTVCLVCGSEFVARKNKRTATGYNIYCSQNCYHEHRTLKT